MTSWRPRMLGNTSSGNKREIRLLRVQDRHLETLRNMFYHYSNAFHAAKIEKQQKSRSNRTILPVIETDNSSYNRQWKTPLMTRVTWLDSSKPDCFCVCQRKPEERVKFVEKGEGTGRDHYCEVLGPYTCQDCIKCYTIDGFKTEHNKSYSNVEVRTNVLCASKRICDQIQYTFRNKPIHLQETYKFLSEDNNRTYGRKKLQAVRFRDGDKINLPSLPVLSPVELHKRVMESYKLRQQMALQHDNDEDLDLSPSPTLSDISISSTEDEPVAPPVVNINRPEPYRRFSAGPDLLSEGFKQMEEQTAFRRHSVVIPTANIQDGYTQW